MFLVHFTSLSGLLISFLQARSRSKNYSRVPLSSSESDHENGHEKLLFASDDDESDNTYPKV